jgi:hypothetical protein
MGTRSLTRINIANGDRIINLYRQFDGYPSGHGKELFEFLNGFEIVNGYSGNEGPKAANGAGCLAAQLVTHFKSRQQEIPDFKAQLGQALGLDDDGLRHAVESLAQYFAPSAKTIGGFYLYPVGNTDMGQDYEYVVTMTEPDWGKPAAVEIKVLGYSGVEFCGTVEEFGAFCSRDEE